MAMHAHFSHDFTKLVYVGRDQKFLSHSGNYQLRMMKWPIQESNSQIILDTVPTIAEEAEFGGLYGSQDTYSHSGFLHDSNNYVINSQLRG